MSAQEGEDNITPKFIFFSNDLKATNHSSKHTVLCRHEFPKAERRAVTMIGRGREGSRAESHHQHYSVVALCGATKNTFPGLW